MNNIIGLKELRKNIDKYVIRVKKGENLIVMRRATPLFKITSVNDNDWEEVFDFSKICKGGVDIKEILSRL
jgi:prevent-host-death family protein